MTLQKISLEAWMSLYDAAIRFEQTACWKWMYDDNIFGVSGDGMKCKCSGKRRRNIRSERIFGRRRFFRMYENAQGKCR